MNSLSQRLLRDPLSFLDVRYHEGFRFEPQELSSFQLNAMRLRFEQLRIKLPVLEKMASEQGIHSLQSFEEAARLLFPHTVYKSYPLSFLERGQFDRLTRWLAGLTTVDLSGVDVGGVQSIDEWIQRLDATTPLSVIHTFGTSGKLSFLPRTKDLFRATVTLNAHCIRDFGGPDSGPDLLRNHMPLITPGYRRGASAIARGMNLISEMFAGGLGNSLFLYPEAYFSADVVSLAGRLRAAEARGEQGQLELSPALLARRTEFAERERTRAQDMDRFFEQATSRFGGRDVFIFAVWPLLFEWAEEGLKRGLKHVFGRNSILTSGGGSKGRVLPSDYKQQIFEFLGVDRTFELYSMSELMVGAPKCELGHFHFPPVIVPFMLDPDSGEMLPREGRQTGRIGLMDLLPDSYWGGLITGDEVTLAGFEEPCGCGRKGLYLESTIRRLSEARGGDDKINCAGAPEAHDRAVDFLLERTR